MEAFEGYWRKTPSVKRLVFKMVPDATTRLAMVKRGEVDIAYLLDAPQAAEVKRDPNLRLAFSGGIAVFFLDYLDQCGTEVRRGADRRVRLATNYAIDRKALSEAETLGASRPRATSCRAPSSSRCPSTRIRTIPSRPSSSSPRPATRTASTAVSSTSSRPTSRSARPSSPTSGRSASACRCGPPSGPRSSTAWGAKRLRGVCVCSSAVYGNAASRMSEVVPSEGTYAYGGYPDTDALYRDQGRETDKKKREAMLHQIQRLMHERVRYGPIFDYIWPSAIGPRVAEPALLMIDPYPWSAPLEEVRLKRP